MRYACIGSRALSDDEIQRCHDLGRHLVQCGHEVHTGNAPGADQAFAAGGSSVDPSLVHLHLPWSTFEAQHIIEGNVVHNLNDMHPDGLALYEQIAADHHPAWSRLSQGVRKLMMRNSSILLPPPETRAVDVCIAFPGVPLGGTGQGMRIAEYLHIRLINMRTMDDPVIDEDNDPRCTSCMEVRDGKGKCGCDHALDGYLPLPDDDDIPF